MVKYYKKVVVNGELMRLHRVIMENHLGRKLLETEIVHHINENKLDNRIENLELTNRSEHIKMHRHEMNRERRGGLLKCQSCGSEKYYCPRMFDRLRSHNYKCRKCYIDGR